LYLSVDMTNLSNHYSIFGIDNWNNSDKSSPLDLLILWLGLCRRGIVSSAMIVLYISVDVPATISHDDWLHIKYYSYILMFDKLY